MILHGLHLLRKLHRTLAAAAVTAWALSASTTAGFAAVPAEDPGALDRVRVASKTLTPDGPRPAFLRLQFTSRYSPDAITVRVFDLHGRLVARPVVQGTGPDYEAVWTGDGPGGRPAPAGIYVYEIRTGVRAYRGAVVLAR